jgi:hypothetical protein
VLAAAAADFEHVAAIRKGLAKNAENGIAVALAGRRERFP